MRFYVTLLVAFLGFVIWDTLSLFCNAFFWWCNTIFFVGLAGYVFWKSFKKIEANPPHKGILTFLGKRQEEILDEGLNFLPWFPHIFGFIPVKVQNVVQDLSPQEVRTPDRAPIAITAAITWKPGIGGPKGKKSLIDFINSGGEEGVKKMLHNIVESRIRTWAASNQEGPSNWEEAQAMKDSALAILVKAILGDALNHVDDKIPTSVLLRYYSSPKSEPTNYDIRAGWAEEVGGVRGWRPLDEKLQNEFSQAERDELKKRVERRMTDIAKLHEGSANFGIENLGITVVQFTVKEVKLEGEAAKAAQDAAKEQQEREADKVELNNVSDRIIELMKKHKRRGITLEQAIQLVQTERGKATKTITAVDLLGLPGAVDKIVSAVLAKLSGGAQNP